MRRQLPFALLLSTLVACGSESAEPRPERLLLITLDTLRVDRLGAYGDVRGLTPELNQLAAEGVVFERAMAPMPCTLPSHTSLLTGLLPLSHGLTSNFLPLDADVPLLAEYLQEAGYETAAFVHQFFFDQGGLSRGLDTFHRDETPDMEQLPGELARWLDSHGSEPRWFVWLHLYLPHHPYTPPQEYLERWNPQPYAGPLDREFLTFEQIRRGLLEAPEDFARDIRRRYDADVAWTDTRLAELLDLFRSRDLFEGTLLVLTADHGESLERGVFALHAPVIRETTLQVPLLVRGPGIRANTRVAPVVELIDLFPTLLEAAGIAVPSACQGRSLWPLMRGAGAEWREEALSMLPTDFLGRSRKAGADLPALALRERRFKLVLDGEDRFRLYDLEADPGELEDVSAFHPEVLERLRTRLREKIRDLPVAGPPEGEMDARTRAQLEALGYVDPERSGPPPPR